MICRRRVPDVILTSEKLTFLDMFAHCKFFTVNVRGLSDGIIGYFKYRCHFDIGLHQLTGWNSWKSIRMTSKLCLFDSLMFWFHDRRQPDRSVIYQIYRTIEIA